MSHMTQPCSVCKVFISTYPKFHWFSALASKAEKLETLSKYKIQTIVRWHPEFLTLKGGKQITLFKIHLKWPQRASKQQEKNLNVFLYGFMFCLSIASEKLRIQIHWQCNAMLFLCYCAVGLSSLQNIIVAARRSPWVTGPFILGKVPSSLYGATQILTISITGSNPNCPANPESPLEVSVEHFQFFQKLEVPFQHLQST